MSIDLIELMVQAMHSGRDRPILENIFKSPGGNPNN